MLKAYLSTLLSACAVCFICVCGENQSDDRRSYGDEYCVIGAGPGGLQMAYFLQQAGRDYTVFEKGSGAGTFFQKYPVHRKLNSFNKVFIKATNNAVKLRHDWNSLLSHNNSLLMTKYTKELYPQADVLVKYLNDYATYLALNVQYNTTISNIHEEGSGLVNMQDQNGKQIQCDCVIIATGLSKPLRSDENQGWEHVEDYGNVSLDLRDYQGKSVLVIGGGASAFEVTDHISSTTSSIHLITHSGVKVASKTHYEGHVRSPTFGVYDTYLLKSLDGMLTSPVLRSKFRKSSLTGKLHQIQPKEEDAIEPGGNAVAVKDNYEGREGYDKVIACLGFHFDDSIFRNKTIIRKDHEGKYPKFNKRFHSSDVINVFFAGAIMHSIDFKTSGGGFIHGFRHLIKSLHHMLEWRNHKISWPSTRFNNLIDLTPHILKRLSEAPDIYHMHGALCDVVIYNDDQTEATYLEGILCRGASLVKLITGHKINGAFMVIAMEYWEEKKFERFGQFVRHLSPSQAHTSNHLHPVLYYYETVFSVNDMSTAPKQWILPKPSRIHHIAEDLTGKFNAPESHVLPLRRFIEQTTGHDLRMFSAKQCLKLNLTMTKVPMSCRGAMQNNISNLVVFNTDLNEQLAKMPSYFLPFQAA